MKLLREWKKVFESDLDSILIELKRLLSYPVKWEWEKQLLQKPFLFLR